jgi:hypothetical protein
MTTGSLSNSTEATILSGFVQNPRAFTNEFNDLCIFVFFWWGFDFCVYYYCFSSGFFWVALLWVGFDFSLFIEVWLRAVDRWLQLAEAGGWVLLRKGVSAREVGVSVREV